MPRCLANAWSARAQEAINSDKVLGHGNDIPFLDFFFFKSCSTAAKFIARYLRMICIVEIIKLSFGFVTLSGCTTMQYSFLMNFHVLYVLKDKTSKKNISVCLSVCRSVWMSGCTWTFDVDTITFEEVSGSKQNCLLCMKCRSGIEIQSKIMILILILNRILIFTKNLRSDTKFGVYL